MTTGPSVTEYILSNYKAAQTLQSAGVEMEKAWDTTGSGDCELCLRNEEAGWIPLNTPFPSGHQYPLGHDGCRCDLLTRRKKTAQPQPSAVIAPQTLPPAPPTPPSTTLPTSTIPSKTNRELTNFIGIILAILVVCSVFVVFISTLGNVARKMGLVPTSQPTKVRAVQSQPTQANIVDVPSTDIPIPTNTPIPLPTPRPELGLNLDQFLEKYNSLTDLQKEEFIKQSKGKYVDWTGEVFDVESDGTIMVKIPGTLASLVSLKNISKDQAMTVSKGQTLHFTGRIQNIIDLLGLHVYLEQVEIVQ